jgi:hypothetical protein
VDCSKSTDGAAGEGAEQGQGAGEGVEFVVFLRLSGHGMSDRSDAGGWHGAAPDSVMMHYAIQKESNGTVADWMDKRHGGTIPCQHHFQGKSP